jgi:hypothetical protein
VGAVDSQLSTAGVHARKGHIIAEGITESAKTLQELRSFL